ncbi:hypothetical protein [Salinimicrobium sp. GXAS 041]|uniref:hypothetical protein n=1 Tax=Salinimicrobium sp. GXAS 041 TaxID=3400806 RepID=UPI003C742279
MKTLEKISSGVLLVLFPLISVSQNSEPFHKAKGFSHPESVILDSANNVLYVSNMADKEAGDGFISKVDPSGEIIEARWITGLNDPKGLLLDGDKLYVTDNKELVEMSLNDAKVTRKIQVKDAVSLNDITQDDEGNIFISDMGQNSIYIMPGEMANNSMIADYVEEGEVTEFFKSDKLNTPNGVLAVGDQLYVGSWGKNQDGNFLRLDTETQEIKKVTEKGIGNLDGIQKASKDSFYVSDWATGTIYSIDKDGNTEAVVTAEKSAGDILFHEEENVLILPMNFQNEVWWYRVD